MYCPYVIIYSEPCMYNHKFYYETFEASSNVILKITPNCNCTQIVHRTCNWNIMRIHTIHVHVQRWDIIKPGFYPLVCMATATNGTLLVRYCISYKYKLAIACVASSSLITVCCKLLQRDQHCSEWRGLPQSTFMTLFRLVFVV